MQCYRDVAAHSLTDLLADVGLRREHISVAQGSIDAPGSQVDHCQSCIREVGAPGDIWKQCLQIAAPAQF